MTFVEPSVKPSALEIELNPEWASSLSYDLLDQPEGRRPIFVGRQHLLDPLVADIKHPEKTGAYLISGYRGSGKTTLLIEALRRAQQPDTSTRRQFVVVLNVSEVSASLESAAEKSSESITIDPRRLLIALLRSLSNRVRSYESNDKNKKLSAQLKARIAETYDKAIAVTYTQASSARREREESRSSKSSFELSATLPYKLGGALAALGALAIEAVASPTLRSGFVHVVAALAAATAAWSWTKSWTLSRSQRDQRSTETTLKFDNSLQQLENDLKDILQLLYKESMRTIVVLEELDKIDDAGGAQLDKVIRYFKNLFTQAPALFFFLADKAYFDLVESRIRLARTRRYYALEHTFFTHRLYVGRPNSQDSLAFLGEAAVNDAHKQQLSSDLIKAAASGDGRRFSQFVRTILFRSANHLFDLKNELRRYVRTVGTSGKVALIVDDQSFPEDEAALSVFQDLVEAKTRAYAFGRERTYANEALQDHLYGVFQEIGSTRQQKVFEFYPQARQEVEIVARGDQRAKTTSIESPLEWDEIQRITDAVDSLITDLARGGAFEAFQGSTFVWRRSPARAFHLERQLEKHEVELLREVRRLIDAIERDNSSGALQHLSPDAMNLLASLRERERTIQQAEASIPLEEANAERESIQSSRDRYLADLYRSYIERVKSRYGLLFDQIQYGAGAEGIYRLRPHGLPPADSNARVEAGEWELFVIVGPFQSSGVPPVAAARPLKRASVIQVVRSSEDAVREIAEVWKTLHQPAPPAVDAYGNIAASPEPAVSLDIIELDEGLPQQTNPDWNMWGQLLGDTIVFRVYWAGLWFPATFENPEVAVARLEGGKGAVESKSTLLDAVASWAQEGARRSDEQPPSRLLWVATPPGGRSNDVPSQSARADVQRWTETLWYIFGQSRLLDVSAVYPAVLLDSISKATQYVINAGDAIRSGAIGQLIQSNRLILLQSGESPDATEAREIRQIWGPRGRAVFVSQTLPDEFQRFSVTRVELP